MKCRKLNIVYRNESQELKNAAMDKIRINREQEQGVCEEAAEL